jgi:hypothetical protein
MVSESPAGLQGQSNFFRGTKEMKKSLFWEGVLAAVQSRGATVSGQLEQNGSAARRRAATRS